MHVAAYLHCLDTYRDRAQMFAHAAERIDRLTLLCGHPPEGPVPTAPGLTVVPLGARPRRRQRVQVQLVRWWAQQTQPVDVLHDTQGFMLHLFARLSASPRRPLRLSSNFASTWDWFHNLRGRWPVEWREREVRYWAQLAGEYALSRVTDHFTVFGEGHRALFARTYDVPLARVHALPNCIDPRSFPAAPPPGDTGFAPDAQVLLFVGAAFRYKGVHELLAAVDGLRATHPRLRLLVVGPMPDRAEAAVRGAIARRGLGDVVRVLGKVPRGALPGLLAAVSALVLPTYTEGSPRVVIEAMASGCPVVASDVAGVRDLDPAGTHLALVPRFDVGALRDALATVLRDPAAARRRARQAQGRYRSHHTPAAAGDTLAALYARLGATRDR